AARPYVFRVRQKDGRYIWVEACTIPVYGSNGHPVAIDYAIHDITAWKQTEAALIQANRKLTLMNSIVRHDIVNQVTVVLGNIGLLQEQPLDADVSAALDKLQAAVKIIQSQIEFTRDYQDLGVRTPRWFPVEPLVTAAAKTLRVTGIRVTTELNGLSIYADPLLSSVFYNLLENAMRHGGTVTEVRVTVVPDGGGARIVWEDNGVGVPAEHKEQIFERGFGSHTGLGLFLVKEVLSITGITISENGTPGAGARFELAVPEGNVRFE
ncbi:MAG: PAS domain-containing sensor histidine kinase, partial [Methanoculleus sp.]|nr:PAS domain-containing sensor histidine kinase [Methanoculleus sp.]